MALLKKSIVLLLLVLAAWRCNNDLVVNAPYENITIIYGLLSTKDRHDSTEFRHYVKINKGFLGEGDAYLFALNPDSNEYQEGEMTAWIEEWNGSVLVDTFNLLPTLIDNRDIGVFYNPEQTVYYFDDTLDQTHAYKIVVNAKGQTITATTPIVDDFIVSGPDWNPAIGINLIATLGYGNWELNWFSSDDGRRYEARYWFNYAEVMTDGDTIQKTIERVLGTIIADNLNGGQPLSASIAGEDFYQGIASVIDPNPDVVKRIFYGVDIQIAVASDDFHTYLTLSDPISGIVEERPSFTNVNGGYGLFASRAFKNTFHAGGQHKKLNDNSLNELINGTYTGSLLFCAAQSSGPPYGCN